MSHGDFEIRTLRSPEELASVGTVFQQVWGSVTPIVGVELLRAISHAGGYVAGAFEGDHVVGASFGFLARHRGSEALHSHITGILPGVQHSGVGRAMKTHQREWAAARDIPWITWTFDPLVRRNAWFNVEVLGAHVSEYLVNFYGPMSDSINDHDETDRLLVAWPTDEATARPVPPTAATTVEIPTPDDVVVLRRTDEAEAMRWRHQVREQLGGALERGGVVTGFTRDGAYVVASPS